MRRNRSLLLAAGSVAAAALLLAAVVGLSGRVPSHSRSAPGETKLASSSTGLFTAAQTAQVVPTTIPPGGVALTGAATPGKPGNEAVELYVKPATDSGPSLTAAQASADALQIDDAPGLTVLSAVYANVTDANAEVPAGTAPPASDVIGDNAWIVTVHSPQPVTMQYGCVALSSGTSCQSATVRNDVLVLSDPGGQLLLGYFY